LATFLRPVFAASRVQQVSDLHSKFALRPRHMCPSLIEIGWKTAEKNSAQTNKQTDTTKIMVT